MTTTAPSSEKYATNAGLLNNSSRSSRERVGSRTIPNHAMSTAPPMISRVPRTIQREKTSPRRNLAKKAFQRSDTAPSGARMTTGREAICTRDPMMLDEMKMPNPNNHSLSLAKIRRGQLGTGHDSRSPVLDTLFMLRKSLVENVALALHGESERLDK
jgi:hypothetical protein